MDFLISFCLRLRKYLLSKGSKKEKIISYYPHFGNHKELSNHYFRALWYLPYKKGVLDKVFLSKSFFLKKKPLRPHFFYQRKLPSQHAKISSNPFSYFKHLLLSDVILSWKEPTQFLEKFSEALGITLLHVETKNRKSIEYGVYPSVLWHHLLPEEEKRKQYEIYKNRFENLCQEVEAEKIEKAFVFGNGPSIEKYKDHSYEKALCIICNSAVQNKHLLATTKPLFITAGDAISHIGVSAYAEKFRNDLFNYIAKHRSYYFGTLEFTYFITLQFPEISYKFILCPQKSGEPTLSLRENFYLPRLASTMNIHMLPLASTFSKEIYLLGVDGKKENEEENEDFWPHAEGFQYHNLVESGHLAHPTFHENRAVNEYKRYIKSVEKTFQAGETKKKIKYIPLAESSIPPIKKRRQAFQNQSL